MRIYYSDHCIKRLKERASSKIVVMDLFADAIKLVKKKKIHAIKAPNPIKWPHYNDPKVFKVYLKWCHFVYKKKWGTYMLITFYQTTWNV